MSSPLRRYLSRLPLALSCMLLITACGGGDEEAKGAAAQMEVRVLELEGQNLSLTLDLVGSTRGTQDVPIRARVEGFLETMDFEEGSFVNKGDPLYSIDPQPFQAKLVEAQSQLAGARTNLTKAASDLARIRPLAEMNAVSQQDLDSAVAAEAASRASVSASEAHVDLANIELSYTKIQAPISGLIGLTQAKPGEFVGREPNPVVLNVLSDVDPIRVRFSISEREYLLLARAGVTGRAEADATTSESKDGDRDPLTLFLADDSEHPFKGYVVARAQSIDQETGTYTVEAAFPNPNLVLLPGQFARVRVTYLDLKDAVVVPRRALNELQGRFRVYIVVDGKVEVRDVKLGPDSGYDVIIESGVKQGDQVITEGLQRIRPGMMVKAVPEQASAPAPQDK